MDHPCTQPSVAVRVVLEIDSGSGYRLGVELVLLDVTQPVEPEVPLHPLELH